MSRGHATKQKPAAARSGPSRSGSDRAAAVQKKSQEKGMASKSATVTKAKVNEKEVPEKEAAVAETPDSPLPLLDLSDAAVKKMIKQAKKRGYVTHEQLNAVLPSEEVSSDQIEDIYAMLNEMGINVVEQEEGADDEEPKAADETEEDDDSDGELVESKPQGARHRREEGAVRAHRRSGADVSARNGLGGTSLPRGRDRHRQAHRGRPRGDDRGPLRKPADVPGHHHLARRIEHRQGVPARHHRPRGDLRRPGRQEQHGDAERPADRPRRPAGRRQPRRAAGRLPGRLASERGAAAGRRAPVGAAVRHPFKPAGDGEASEGGEQPASDGDFDDDDMENSLSLAAIEAELKPKVVETFDKIADAFKRLRRLQDQDIQLQLKSDALSPAQERKYKKLKKRSSPR